MVDAGRGATASVISFTLSLILRSGLLAASRRMSNATAHGSRRAKTRVSP
jgi:hypothetical protein